MSTDASLRSRLRDGRVLGTFVKLPATEVVDIVDRAGFDFALVDLEHSQLGDSDALSLVRHAYAIGLPAVVRIPQCDRGLINRLLEAGAAGIQLSRVRSVSDVRCLVDAVNYPPKGHRSVSLAHTVAGYGEVPLREAVAVSRPLVVCQIETAVTDDSLEEIFRAGVEVAFVGTTDLLVDLGLDAEKLRTRTLLIEAVASRSNVIYGTFASDASQIPSGARFVALSSDLAMLASTARKMVTDAS